MRPTALLRLHATLPLIPKMNLDPAYKVPTQLDIQKQAQWATWRREEGYVGLWKKGEWEDIQAKAGSMEGLSKVSPSFCLPLRRVLVIVIIVYFHIQPALRHEPSLCLVPIPPSLPTYHVDFPHHLPSSPLPIPPHMPSIHPSAFLRQPQTDQTRIQNVKP
jgi:hypothetical protein